MRSIAVSAAAGLLVAAALSAPAQVFAAVPGHERALELVTPAEPVGASVGGVQKLAADGTRVVYTTGGLLPGAPAGDLEATNLATRGTGGWGNAPLGFPYSSKTVSLGALLNAIRPVAFGADLEPLIWLSPEPLTPGGPPEGHGGLYRVQPDGSLTLLADIGEEAEFIGSSEAASHVVFSSKAHLLPGDAGRLKGKSIYEVSGSEERLVDVDSAGSLLSSCGSVVDRARGVSRSGERILFTNPAPSESCAEPSQVYLREGGSQTVDVSASQCTRLDCNMPASSSFAGATPSGSSIFFTSVQQLTNADHDEQRDLYRYDVDGGVLSLVSEEIAAADGEVEDGPVEVSTDGSRVYLEAHGRLLPGQGSAAENLYLADAGGLHLVAPTGVGAEELQISRNGQIALFATSAALEAGDTDGRSDVYLWSADSETTARLSRGTLSDNGDFDARISSPLASQAVLIAHPGTYRALTEDGREAFFSTDERLLPEDVNEVTDVYGWSQGELSLISSGGGSDAAEFAGASPDGQTVLFKTAAALLPVDQDGGARDLYAARVGGGFPAGAPVPPAACGENGCPPAPRSRLARQAPASAGPDAGAKRGRLDLLHIDRHAAVSISRGRPLKLRVRVPAPGRIDGRAQMRVGGHSRVAAQGVVGAVRAGKVVLALRVAPAARARLRRLRVLRVRLVLRQAEQRLHRRLTLTLGGRER
jgi:hypothetical protein